MDFKGTHVHVQMMLGGDVAGLGGVPRLATGAHNPIQVKLGVELQLGVDINGEGCGQLLLLQRLGELPWEGDEGEAGLDVGGGAIARVGDVPRVTLRATRRDIPRACSIMVRGLPVAQVRVSSKREVML